MSAIYQKIEIPSSFKPRLEAWLSRQPVYAIFDSNSYCGPYSYNKFNYLAAWDVQEMIELNSGNVLQTLQACWQQNADFWFGFLGYDLKNEVENLESQNDDFCQFPGTFFFRAKFVIFQDATGWHCNWGDNTTAFLTAIMQSGELDDELTPALEPKLNLSEQQYIKNIGRLKEHIAAGNIYEINYCVQFRAEGVQSPMALFSQLRKKSPMPYSGLLVWEGYSIISASPERFLKKEGNKLIAQPIKGTVRRSIDNVEDAKLRQSLQNSEKDRAENVMIVDLTRNDLTRYAIPGTVQVDDLFGVYSYPIVHHMISTISARIQEFVDPLAPLKQAFPMGSMTGAPKVRAMQLIEEFENFKRGPFSGALGYLSPDGNFDFNVLIRSIFQNHMLQRLAFCAGGAITWDSDAGQEWDEMHLKAEAIKSILSSKY